jgi:hypothetical protein
MVTGIYFSTLDSEIADLSAELMRIPGVIQISSWHGLAFGESVEHVTIWHKPPSSDREIRERAEDLKTAMCSSEVMLHYQRVLR